VLRILQRGQQQEQQVAGIMVVDLSNNAWVIDAANQLAPVFIAPQDTASAASGDAVIAQLLPRTDGKLVGKVLRITERAPPPRQLQNRLLLDSAENFYIEDSENANKPVFITPPDLNGAEKGDRVLVQLHPVWRKDAPASGTLLMS
jgi:exoribonuclease R